MDILIEFTGETGVTQRLQINDAPQGTELVVLEQFLAGPDHLARMISEAGEGRQEPENVAEFLPEFRVDIAGPSEESIFAIRETIEKQQQHARRSGRVEFSPIRSTTAGERIRRTKEIRTINTLQAAAADCLKMLEESRKSKQQT